MEQSRESVDKLILHGLVVTMDNDLTVLEDGGIAIAGSEIVCVGPTSELMGDYDAAEIIDASGQIVMPGLINAHTHAPATLFRSLAEDLVLQDWLDKLWKAERQFTRPDTVRAGARLAYFEMIRGGTTTSLDMYWYPETSVKVAKEVGFRLMTGPVFMDTLPLAEETPIEQCIKEAREFLEEFRNDPLIIPCLQPHATYTVSPEYLQQIKELGEEFGVVFATHVSENEAEVANIKKRYGRTPIEHLEQLGLLDDQAVLFHCVKISGEEIDLLARRGAIVVHNVVSNLKLASGIAPVPAMKRAGVNVTLGTDGPQSSNDFNMWLTMRLAALLQKGVHQDATLLPASDVVKMATCDAAEALGLERIGSLEAGKLADIILIDLHQPHLIPMYDLYAHLVYSVGREDVTTVLINGQVVMRDRQMLTIDEEKTLADMIAIGKQIALKA